MPTHPYTPPSVRRIFFDRLTLNARLGILEHELQAPQPIYIDAEFDARTSQRVNDEDIATVLDYRQLRDAMIEECTQGHVNLLESLVEQVAQRIFQDFPAIVRVRLRIGKPEAFADCAAVGIELEQSREA
ncbi:MAG TPA: dihydroneopterin aldolase [Candidatus Paenalcaligenes intestinipullorum]|uniref:dihydroneopterin aldolase n=1 Tax=Candidatus Paenalcaligenes intestinipullorum TaxID=2838718 RepID=A0A9D2RJK1_9BURK|nr:dihydroneopterin aldolase [Candidatus Paenalcaligenes intestinipullorum]